MDKKPINAFTSNGVVWEGQKDFDQEYKSIKIVDKVVKTGEGEDDYIIEKKVIEEFTPIQKVIDVDKESVGVYNIIKQVLRTGDESLLPRDSGDCNVDFVGAPENLMELKQMGEQATKNFEKLPGEIVKDRDMATFVKNMTQEEFDAFVKAVADRSSGKVEENNE